MRLKGFCAQCVREATDKVDKTSILDIELRNDVFYDCTCAYGHKSRIVLRNEKFELLFESGARALLDGYYREAVSSFAAALERFLEFYIKVIILKRDVLNDDFEKSWKLAAKQSERQLGAFLFLYLLENKKTVNFIDQKHTTFRNRVIHEGFLPTYEEAIEYGEAILAFIFEISRELKEDKDYPQIVGEFQNQKLYKYGDIEDDSFLVLSNESTIIKMNQYGEGFGAYTLRESLAKLKEQIKVYNGPL